MQYTFLSLLFVFYDPTLYLFLIFFIIFCSTVENIKVDSNVLRELLWEPQLLLGPWGTGKKL